MLKFEKTIVETVNAFRLVHFIGELLTEDQRALDNSAVREICEEFVYHDLGHFDEEGHFIYTGTKI